MLSPKTHGLMLQKTNCVGTYPSFYLHQNIGWLVSPHLVPSNVVQHTLLNFNGVMIPLDLGPMLGKPIQPATWINRMVQCIKCWNWFCACFTRRKHMLLKAEILETWALALLGSSNTSNTMLCPLTQRCFRQNRSGVVWSGVCHLMWWGVTYIRYVALEENLDARSSP